MSKVGPLLLSSLMFGFAVCLVFAAAALAITGVES